MHVRLHGEKKIPIFPRKILLFGYNLRRNSILQIERLLSCVLFFLMIASSFEMHPLRCSPMIFHHSVACIQVKEYKVFSQNSSEDIDFIFAVVRRREINLFETTIKGKKNFSMIF